MEIEFLGVTGSRNIPDLAPVKKPFFGILLKVVDIHRLHRIIRPHVQPMHDVDMIGLIGNPHCKPLCCYAGKLNNREVEMGYEYKYVIINNLRCEVRVKC